MKRGLVEDLTMSFEDTNTKRRVWGREFTSDQAQDIKVLNDLNRVLDDYSIVRRGKEYLL